MWEEGGIQWTNGMVGHIIVRMGIPSMGGGGGVPGCLIVSTYL